MNPTGILRSLAHPATIAATVREHYGLDVTACVLVRSLVNDVYTITTPDRRYVLKLYGPDRWTPDEVAWEGELARFLDTNGVPVAIPVPLLDGSLSGSFDAPEGVRPFAMSEYVRGVKPTPPFDAGLYVEFGVLVAKLHKAAQSFRSARSRRDLNIPVDIDDMLDGRPEKSLVRDLVREAQARLDLLSGQGLTRGIRHGDVSLDNIHRTEAGLTIHDFDLAAPGWIAADLTGCLATPFAADFEAGYATVRQLSEADRTALPWFRVLESAKNLRFHLVDKVAWRGSESLAEGWAERELENLCRLASQLH